MIKIPVPFSFTLKVIASLILTIGVSIIEVISNLPTAPLKSDGGEFGYLLTIIFIESDWMNWRWVSLNIELKKASLKGLFDFPREGVSTLHIAVIGAIIKLPVWVGNKADLYSVATL